MIPSLLFPLETLPLTPVGKVDQKALQKLEPECPVLSQEFVPPQNLTEEKITKFWQEVLNLDRIGVYDNFFDLGGYSLAATQIVSRLLQEFGIKIPLEKIFETPTIAGLAEIIDKN